MIKNALPNTQVTEYLYQKSSINRYPLSGTFELTPMCNFSCKMCYIHKTEAEIKKSSRKAFGYDEWIKLAREMQKSGTLYLLLTGGEPFVLPYFKELYVELIKMGFIVSINTNGSLINEEIIKTLIKYPPRRINITLYGITDKTYENLCGIKNVFNKVDNAIKTLIKNGITVKLNCSLTPYNIRDLDEIIEYSKNAGTILSATSYMFPPVRRDESLTGINNARFTPEETAKYRMEVYKKQNTVENYRKTLNNILKGSISPPGLDENCEDPIDGKVRCRAGRSSFWITWDGYMTPCGMMPEPKIDLIKNDFLQAWNEIVRLTDNFTLSGVCDKCPNADICHPCVAIAYAETGETFGIPTYLCRVTQEMQNIAKKELNI